MNDSQRWYDSWAIAHCVAFGFGDEKAKTVFSWGPVFTRLYTEGELREATAYLLTREDVSAWPGDQRGQIISAVREIRRRKASQARPESYAAGVCAECWGDGVILVPHPGLDEYGRWRGILLPPKLDTDGERGAKRTVAVCCVMCEKGRLMRESSVQAKRPQMTISGYESLYPSWPAVQKARAELIAAGQSNAPPTAEQLAELNRTLAGAREAAAKRERQGY